MRVNSVFVRSEFCFLDKDLTRLDLKAALLNLGLKKGKMISFTRSLEEISDLLDIPFKFYIDDEDDLAFCLKSRILKFGESYNNQDIIDYFSDYLGIFEPKSNIKFYGDDFGGTIFKITFEEDEVTLEEAVIVWSETELEIAVNKDNKILGVSDNKYSLEQKFPEEDIHFIDSEWFN